MGASDVVELRSSSKSSTARVEIDVAAGGRIRQVEVSAAGDAVMLLADPPVPAPAGSSGWGSFPMAPWAGRIRHGRFDFLDRHVALDLNHDDSAGAGGAGLHPAVPAAASSAPGADDRRHSIHGTTFTRPWDVTAHSANLVTMRCELVGALGWPYEGEAVQRISVGADHVRCELEVTTAGEPFPASIGWHPWFAKPARLEFSPIARYELDDLALPTGRLVTPGDGPWDDCFIVPGPTTLHYERDVAPRVTVTSDADHLVVYDRPAHATCVEPQSGPPDAPNVRPELVGMGQPLRRTMTWSW